MKTAFVSGPYFNVDAEKIKQNIESAKDCAIWLWNHDYAVFCPHLNSAWFHTLTNAPEETFLQFCLKIIRSNLIDILVHVPNWSMSNGSWKEHNLALNLQIPIYRFNKDRLERTD